MALTQFPPVPPGDPSKNPAIWKDWFAKMQSAISNTIAGAVSWGEINFSGSNLDNLQIRNHNDLQGIQGGAMGDNQHVTTAGVANLTGYTNPVFTITSSGSPFTYHNTAAYRVDVLVNGGTLSAMQFSRDNITWITVSPTTGVVALSPGDYFKATYTVAPTLTGVPR